MKERTIYERINTLMHKYVENQPEIMNLMKCAEVFQELSHSILKSMTEDGNYEKVSNSMVKAMVRMHMLMHYVNKEEISKKLEEEVKFIEELQDNK